MVLLTHTPSTVYVLHFIGTLFCENRPIDGYVTFIPRLSVPRMYVCEESFAVLISVNGIKLRNTTPP